MSLYKRIKKRIYEIIGPAQKGDTASVVFDIFLSVLVILSCAAVFVDIFVPVPETVQSGLIVFEYITVGVFILEYIVRLWVCEYQYPECKNKFSAIWEFVTSFDSLMDIISIVSVLFNGIPKELAILRMVKLVKLVRLVKIAGYIKTSQRADARMKRIQRRTLEIIDKGKEKDIASKIYDGVSVVLIIFSVAVILLETFTLTPAIHRALYIFELVLAVIFSLEYVLRVWVAPLEYPELRPDKARMRYIFSFMSLVDVLSIVPVFVAGMSTATGILKIFKLCKVVRLLKASRYLSSIANFGLAIQRKKRQITMSVIAILVTISICSVLMYSVENKAQPEVFSNGFSGIIYSLQTILESDTDIKPVTAAGRALSVAMLLLGGCIVGVPLAIIATGFEDMIEEQAREDEEENADIYETLRLYDALDDEKKRRFERIIAAEYENEKRE